jgi:hypothetical protein
MVQNFFPRASNLSKRIYYYRRNNAPYLSGDVFADTADAQVFPPFLRSKWASKKSISEAQILFCPSSMAEQFFHDYKGSINAKVLLFGNGDEEFDSFNYKIPKSVKRIYLQNLLFNDNLFRLLPIGLENIRLIRNGFPKNFVFRQAEKDHRVLIGPFSETHETRKIINETVYSSKLLVKHEKFQSPAEIDRIASNFKFVAAPRGNGVDTHRFWETLYRGGIPIVEKSRWSENLNMLDIDYREVEKFDESNLIRVLTNFKDAKVRKSHSDLWIGSWIKKFKQDL